MGEAISAEQNAIAVRGLNKRFGDKHVVKDFSITVPRGRIYGFLGPNGSGKTTTIRILCGLLTADSGAGTCLGYDVIRQSAQIKARVGYMTQKFSLYPDLTIRENIRFFARMHSLPQARRAAERVMETYQLTSRADQLAGALSGGWKQRLALAACTLSNPDLLLLDEPTAGVDPKARRDFWDRIRTLARQGVTVLVSTHYMDEAVQCDDIAFIACGTKLVDAPSARLAQDVGLYTYKAEGHGLNAVLERLEGKPGVAQVARFGASIHVSGTDLPALKRALTPFKSDASIQWSRVSNPLEDAFIFLMSGQEDNFA